MMEVAASPTQSVLTPDQISKLFYRQQAHQYEVARSNARARKAKLWRLHDALVRHREDIRAALWADFKKPAHEVDISETICVNSEIRHAIRHLSSWLTPRRVGVRLPLLGSSAQIRYEPKGVCLIIGPWNFPFNLNLIPLASAVAAGNCVVIKPSEHAPHSAALLRQIVGECFAPEEVAVVEGDVDVAQYLLSLPFNHIFFTGSTGVGKIVMQAAAQHLASVTLELGGKSPVLVDETADLDRAASRIMWIKCLNGGQTCIAPDYVLVHESVHDALVQKLQAWAERYYGLTPAARRQSPDLSRMVHDRHFQSVKNLLDDAVGRGGRVAFGGQSDAATRYLEPTVLTDVPEDARIWEQEIFGYLLPLRRYTTTEEAIGYINARPQPLSFYIFSRRESYIEKVIRETRGGGVCINECALQFFNPNLPFGGQNASGIGKSHGESGFLEFSNARSVARQHSPFPSTNIFLPPYGSRLMNLALNWMIRWL
ncbi:MAG: aldehyde dehydrogenase family protein [Saprospiraceae bacterium]|nr:aldehyde dehydrogenase family protein [Saprospiraceae bacterium]